MKTLLISILIIIAIAVIGILGFAIYLAITEPDNSTQAAAMRRRYK